ncbi:hypothetical protein CHS0354_015965, partial [Potamilus streckersoni]
KAHRKEENSDKNNERRQKTHHKQKLDKQQRLLNTRGKISHKEKEDNSTTEHPTEEKHGKRRMARSGKDENTVERNIKERYQGTHARKVQP